jgi:hypothetical protein
MKSKLFWSCCTVLVASLPMPSFAEIKPVEVRFDYKGGSLNYQILPGKIPDRTLPKAFDFPIITNVAVDTSITSEHLITDLFRAPATRPEYTRALIIWAAAVSECMTKKPLLIRASTNNPVLFDGKVGTIVRNASNHAVCK